MSTQMTVGALSVKTPTAASGRSPRWSWTHWHTVAVLGGLLGLRLSIYVDRALPRTAGWQDLCQHAPHAARFVALASVLVWPAAIAILAGAIFNFLVVKGVVREKSAPKSLHRLWWRSFCFSVSICSSQASMSTLIHELACA